MISITAEEKNIVLSKYPNTYMVRTMKQDSKRHHYFMVEDPAQMRLINSLRGIGSADRKNKNKK